MVLVLSVWCSTGWGVRTRVVHPLVIAVLKVRTSRSFRWSAWIQAIEETARLNITTQSVTKMITCSVSADTCAFLNTPTAQYLTDSTSSLSVSLRTEAVCLPACIFYYVHSQTVLLFRRTKGVVVRVLPISIPHGMWRPRDFHLWDLGRCFSDKFISKYEIAEIQNERPLQEYWKVALLYAVIISPL